LVDRAQHGHHHPQVGGHRLLAGEGRVAALLERVGEVVDGAVGVDHPVGGDQVGLEEGVGAGGDGVGGHEAEPHDVDPQVVELAVVVLPNLVHSGILSRVEGAAVRVVRFPVGVRVSFTFRCGSVYGRVVSPAYLRVVQMSTVTPPLVTPARPGPAERPEADREIVFSVSDVDIYYGATRAVAGVNCDVGAHEITAIIGPSGCGKSTLLRCFNRMNDLIPGARVEGKILYKGHDVYGDGVNATEVRRRIGMVFQKPNP